MTTTNHPPNPHRLTAQLDALREAHARVTADLARVEYANAIGAPVSFPAHPVGYVLVWLDRDGAIVHGSLFESFGQAWRIKTGLRPPRGRTGGAWTLRGVGPSAEPRELAP